MYSRLYIKFKFFFEILILCRLIIKGQLIRFKMKKKKKLEINCLRN